MKIKLQPNIQFIVSILLILYVVSVKCMCVAKERWFFGTKEEEDDMAALSAIIQEAREEEAATAEAEAAELASVDCRKVDLRLCQTNPACEIGTLRDGHGPFAMQRSVCINKNSSYSNVN